MVAVKEELRLVLDEFPDARREHLIPILQAVQGRMGYLSRDAMVEVGRRLSLPVSKVYGVATFYNQFRFQPLGKVHCQVCRGTACHVKGGEQMLDVLERRLGVRPGETTEDGEYDLERVACLGCCALAPVVTVDEKAYSQMSVLKLQRLLDDREDD